MCKNCACLQNFFVCDAFCKSFSLRKLSNKESAGADIRDGSKWTLSFVIIFMENFAKALFSYDKNVSELCLFTKFFSSATLFCKSFLLRKHSNKESAGVDIREGAKWILSFVITFMGNLPKALLSYDKNVSKLCSFIKIFRLRRFFYIADVLVLFLQNIIW